VAPLLTLLVMSLAPALAGGAVQELVITRQPWYGVQAQSPRLPAESLGLDFALRPARSSEGPTVALLGAARLPGRYGDIYGGRIHGAIQMVAIDAEGGGVYHSHAERGDAVPLAAVMNPAPRPPASGVAAIQEVETYFNVDLRAQLGLPAHRGRYAVFLWLDEITSPVRMADLPSVPPEATARPAPDASSGAIDFRKTEWTPKAAGTGIVLRLASPRQRRPGQLRVYGAVSPALLSGSPLTLTVLALDYRSRSLKWRCVPVPRQARATREGAFDFDLAGILGESPWRDAAEAPQKMFVTASLGRALSNVLVIDRAGL